MAFQPLEDGLRAVISWGDEDDIWSNVLHFTRTDYDLDDQLDMANLIHEEMEAAADIYLCANWDLLSVVTYDIRTEIGPIVTDIRSPYTGGIVGAAGAINVGCVATLYSAARGKSGRGRMYLAGWAEDDMGATAIEDTTMLDALIAHLLAGVATYGTNGWAWVVASGQQNKIVLEELVAYPIINVVSRNATFGTQRRRVDRD